MDDLVTLSKKFLDKGFEEDESRLLNEIISLRTGLIASGLVKTKQYANKIDIEVKRLQQSAADSKNTESTTESLKKLSDAMNTLGTLFYLNRKMMLYVAITSASTGINSSKHTEILKKLNKM